MSKDAGKARRPSSEHAPGLLHDRRVCRRCGLPRRRSLLTPDGKTFSFGNYSEFPKRSRGLLLASGAALCCCCVDIVATGDTSSGGWTGATYTNIDEWPADDATTEMTVNQVQVGVGSVTNTATFTAADLLVESGISRDLVIRWKSDKIQHTPGDGNQVITVTFKDGATAIHSKAVAGSSTPPPDHDTWNTTTDPFTPGFNFNCDNIEVKSVVTNIGTGTMEFTAHVSATAILCP